jgi:dTDP-4-dehydrorhamnose 3,5-epimerase
VKPLPTRLDGPLLFEPPKFGDERGFFSEAYRSSWLSDAGVTAEWVQDNHSRSTRGVVRGMHFQSGPPQAKLVRCPRGAILDVLVDVRRGSPTFGEWEAFELDDRSLRLLYVPSGFAHGFCALDELNDVIYKQTAYYDPSLEGGIAWNDPDVGIEWPAGVDYQVSERDSVAPRLSEVADSLPFTWSEGR